MKPRLYGIRNCDTVKKARRWLDDRGIDYEFHDLREAGVDPQALADWSDTLGWEALLNRRSTSWRQLDAADKVDLDGTRAQALMLRVPTLIKRPVLVRGRQVSVGFSPAVYQSLLERGDDDR